MTNCSVLKNWVFSIFYILVTNGCAAPQTGSDEILDYSIDTTAIPRDTVAYLNPKLTYENGEYLLSNTPYSGIVSKVETGYRVLSYSSVFNGRLHGTYRSFYSSGKPYEIRKYRNGLAVGKSIGYWENTGLVKFEYNYYDEKKEGAQKNWYSTGSLAYVYTYRDDKLDGLQQAWRENGSLYRNFEAREGVRYGLQKAQACYEVSGEEVVMQANKLKLE